MHRIKKYHILSINTLGTCPVLLLVSLACHLAGVRILGGREQLEGSVQVKGEFHFSMSGGIWKKEIERVSRRDDV